jgi:hypothetical protein
MDQFRGYTVAGMFLVNFLGGYAAIHSVLKHNDTYFSYADSIMPSFMFAVGFSFRLTYLRRRGQMSTERTVWTYVRRSVALVVVSLVMYGFGGGFHHWMTFAEMPAEYQPFHAKPPHNPSFEFLLKKVHAAHPGGDERSAIEAASKIGEMAAADEPKKADERARYAIAQEAVNHALEEGRSFVDPAVHRAAEWEALGWPVKMLVHWRIFGAKLLKSDLWETLAIIGVTQLVVLPWIGFEFGVRFLALVGLGVLHCVLCYWFNWDFAYGLNDSWTSKLWMTGDNRSWDGGFFGPLSWGVAMMAGTLAYDLIARSGGPRPAIRQLLLWGAGFMIVGYGMSCLTRLYELNPEEVAQRKELRMRHDAEKGWLGHVIERQEKGIAARRKPLDDLQGAINEQKHNDFLVVYKDLSAQPENAGRSAQVIADRAERLQKDNPRPNAKLKELDEQSAKMKQTIDPEIAKLRGTVAVLREQQKRYPNLDLAESPVLPPWERLKGRSLSSLLVEPPFVQPPRDDPRVDAAPHIEHRPRNYWMMGKRTPSLSFITFATGFAFALYGLFVVVCDVWGMRLGVFETFGTNALAAYFLHHVVEEAIHPLVPDDAHLWYCLGGLALFFWLTYVCVRYLETRKIFLKL